MLVTARPDLLGSVTAYFGDGEFTELAYFTSEEAARKGESGEMPDEMAEPVRRVATSDARRALPRHHRSLDDERLT